MSAQLTLASCVRGDNYALLHPVTGLLPGTTIASAECIVKQAATSTTAMPGLPAKSLTTSFVVGTGNVINVGGYVPANNGGFANPATQPYILVVFTPADTAALVGGLTYILMVQITDNLGNLYTTEISSWPILSGIAG